MMEYMLYDRKEGPIHGNKGDEKNRSHRAMGTAHKNNVCMCVCVMANVMCMLINLRLGR